MLHPSAVLPQEFSLFATDPAKVRFMLFRLGQNQETCVDLLWNVKLHGIGAPGFDPSADASFSLHEHHWV